MAPAHILIVDDQRQVREEVRERIESLGCEADEAVCQDEALLKVKSLQYDCVLLDLNIPVKLEGVSLIEHGRNTLERIVSMASAPPVIVITSHGLEGHNLAVEMMEIGAKSFVAKPFDGGHLELKIKKILGDKKHAKPQHSETLKPFVGGALVMNENGIELCGVIVGGRRTGSIIRRVVELLSIKKNNRFRKESGKSLASAISNSADAASITSAIMDFRRQCTEKLLKVGIDCSNDAVVNTAKGGGYQFQDWIDVRLGSGGNLSDEVEQDCEQVMRAFGRDKKRTLKQIVTTVSLPATRVQVAVRRLEQRRKLKNCGGSGVTTAYELIQPSP